MLSCLLYGTVVYLILTLCCAVHCVHRELLLVCACRPALCSRDYLNNAKKLKHRADDTVCTSVMPCMSVCLSVCPFLSVLSV